MVSLGRKLKRQKTTLQPYYSYSIQKTTGRNTQQSRNDKIMRGVKSGRFTKAIVRQNGQFGREIKKVRKVQKRPLYNDIPVILWKR